MDKFCKIIHLSGERQFLLVKSMSPDRERPYEISILTMPPAHVSQIIKTPLLYKQKFATELQRDLTFKNFSEKEAESFLQQIERSIKINTGGHA